MTEEEVIEFVKNFHKQRGMKNIDDVYEILESDVEINSSSSSIPLDTLIEVDVIGKYHKEFK